ncbi:short-chain dehydrogenase, partial [Chloroflexota bacterium]
MEERMVGIVSYGVYIPRYRINREVISSAMGWFSSSGIQGAKAVANYDEDSLTMAFAAGFDCIRGFDKTMVEALYLATTTAPYRERESAPIIATALDLPATVRTADLTDSLKAGTGSFLLACDSIRSGAVNNALVCAADCRLAKPGSRQETVFGDGAAAVLLGTKSVIASLEGSFSLAYDFPDHWRTASDKFDRTLEDRWIRDEGYNRFIPQSIKGLLEKFQLQPKDISKVIFPGIYVRDHRALAKNLGFQPDQIQDPLISHIGDSGTASPLIMLTA